MKLKPIYNKKVFWYTFDISKTLQSSLFLPLDDYGNNKKELVQEICSDILFWMCKSRNRAIQK
jgi:hypothetical protein